MSSPASSAVGGPGRHIDFEDRPRFQLGVARALVGDRMALGYEATGLLVILDPVASIVAGAFDGTTSLRELADDVAAAAECSTATAEKTVWSVLYALESTGFITGPLPKNALPRRRDVRLPAESCLGQRWGVSRSTHLQVGGHDGFRISCTDPEVTREIEAVLGSAGELVDPDEELMDTFHLRAVSGATPRVQQIFDTLDMRFFAGRDIDTAIEAFHRTIEARLLLRSGGAFLQGPSIERDGRIVLIHPTLWERCTGTAVRTALEAHGLTLTPTGMLRLVDGRVELPSDRFQNRPSRWLEPAAILEPDAWEQFEHVRQAMHLLRWWDGSGFSAMSALAPKLPGLVALPEDEKLAVSIVSALDGNGVQAG